MNNDAATEPAGDSDVDYPAEIAFHFIKSNFFRVIHVDGIWGGMAPGGHIHITLYNERGAIPKRVVFGVAEDGTLGEEISNKRKARKGLVREVEADLVMDLDTARGFQDWIANAISEAEALMKQSEAE